MMNDRELIDFHTHILPDMDDGAVLNELNRRRMGGDPA